MSDALWQAGDSAILVEFGELDLDVVSRARVHAFETALRTQALDGIWALTPCIRSTMVFLLTSFNYRDNVLMPLPGSL